MAWWDQRYNALTGQGSTTPSNTGGTNTPVNTNNQWWANRYKTVQADEQWRVQNSPVTPVQVQPEQPAQPAQPTQPTQPKKNLLQKVGEGVKNLFNSDVPEPDTTPIQTHSTTQPAQKSFIDFLFSETPDKYKSKNILENLNPLKSLKRGVSAAQETLAKPEYTQVRSGMAMVQGQLSIDKQIENIQNALQKSADKDVASGYSLEDTMRGLEPKKGFVSPVELESYRTNIFKEIVNHPATYMAEAQKYIEPIMTGNQFTGRLSKSVTDFFLGIAGGSKKADAMWQEKLKEPITAEDKVLATTGEVAGTVLSLIGGGAILKGFGLAKASAPLLYEVMGQESLPKDTPLEDRFKKAPLYLVAGWLTSKIGLPKKFLSMETLTGATKSGAIMSGQAYIDYLTRGYSPKETSDIALRMASVGVLYHIGFSAASVAIRPKTGSVSNVEFTPAELRSRVVGSAYQDTDLGKQLIKLSVEAESSGKNISLNAQALGKSPLAKTFGMKAPNGLNVDAKLVDPNPQLKTTTNNVRDTGTAQPEAQQRLSTEGAKVTGKDGASKVLPSVDAQRVAQGWKGGDLEKKAFDAAMLHKDVATVKKMLPDVPQAYKDSFKKELTVLVGDTAPALGSKEAALASAKKAVSSGENAISFIDKSGNEIGKGAGTHATITGKQTVAGYIEQGNVRSVITPKDALFELKNNPTKEQLSKMSDLSGSRRIIVDVTKNGSTKSFEFSNSKDLVENFKPAESPSSVDIARLPVVFTKNADKYVRVEDFADSIEGSNPQDQVGLLDPKTITARDPIEQAKVDKMVEDINSGNAEEMPPIVIERTDAGNLQTFEGSHRVTSYGVAGQFVPVIYHGKDPIPGLIKIEDLYKLLNEKGAVQKGIQPQEVKKPATEGIVEPNPQKGLSNKVEFKVGDVLDPQGNTNMVGTVTIREISGNTLKFVDSKGTEFAGMQRATVRTLINGGSWKRIEEKKPKTRISAKSKQKEMDKIEKQARVESSPFNNPDINQYAETINRAVKVYNLTKAKGQEDISTITKKVPGLDEALGALGDAGYNVETMDDLIALKKKGNGGYADLGGYSDVKSAEKMVENLRSVEFPELLRMAKELMGSTPTLKKFTRALGKFRPSGSGSIRLSPEIFKDPKLAVRVFAHEIGHLADYLPDKAMDRGNILGRIATLKRYMNHLLPESKGGEPILTEEDRKRLHKEATALSKTEVTITEEVVTGETPVEAQDILSIWNDSTSGIRNPDLLKYIQKLSDKEKVAIVKQAMKGNVPEWVTFKKQVKETITRKVIKNAPEDVRKVYKQLVKDEIIKRRLFESEVITNELKKLTQLWKPFPAAIDPSYTKYRYSSVELYADALSVLFNDPALLKTEAPSFFKAFFNYIDEKPEFSKAFFDLQDLLNNGSDTVMKRRNEEMDKMFKSGEQKYVSRELEKQKRKTSLLFDLQILLDDKNQAVINQLKKVKKSGAVVADAANPVYALEELNYLDAKIRNTVEKTYQPAFKKSQQVDGGWDELGKIVFYERVINERGELANPAGYDPKTAQDQLNYLERTTDPKDWAILQDSKRDFRNATQELNNIFEREGFYSPEMIEQMKANPAYVTFQVVDYLDTYISPAIYKSVGTLKDVANPATSTVMKTISILKAIERNNAKKVLMDFQLAHFNEDTLPAKTRFNGKFREVVESKDPDKELVTVIRNGELSGYYVDPYIARTVKYMSNDTVSKMAKVVRTISGASFYRPIFTGVNLGFQTFNFVRDFERAWKSMPDKNLGEALISFAKIHKNYFQAIKPAWARVTNQPNEIIKNMENLKILGLTYNDLGKSYEPEDAQIERTLNKIGIGTGQKDRRFVAVKAVSKLLDGAEILGNFIETLPKVAGYQQLKNSMPEKELASLIRTKVGSPDFRRSGTATPITNSVFLFSNAIKEGTKADFQTATDPRTRAGYWWKTFLINIFPKILMLLAAGGFMGKKVKDIMDNASEYDKTNYIIIPLDLDKNGKGIYIRKPQDETGRLIGGMFWKAANIAGNKEMKLQDLADIFSFNAGQLPTLTPSFEGLGATIAYLSGLNPYDSFRGRLVIPDTEFKAGYKYSFPIFMNWLVQNQGLGIVVPSYTPQDTEMTTLQKVLSLPVLSNIVGRWVKVSDYGKTESYRKITNEVVAEKAAKTVEENNKIQQAFDAYKKTDKSDATYRSSVIALVESVIGQTFDKLDKDGVTKGNAVIKKFNMSIIRGRADPEVNALISATSNDAKAELLVPMLKSMKSKDAQEFLKQMVDEKVITSDVLEKYAKLK